MDRFQQMIVFVAVAEEESFSVAARRLGLSPPTVSRAVAALENALNVQLFNRTTRWVRMTDAGERYLQDARAILDDVAAAEEAAQGVNSTPSGPLSVTAPQLFGRRFVLPGVVDYLQRYPGTQVTALFLDRVVNLLEEDVDVGVRIGELPDSTLRAIRVGSVRAVVCGAPGYLDAHGRPANPGELSGHRLVNVGTGGGPATWRFRVDGSLKDLRVRPRLSVTTSAAGVAAAVGGFGLTRQLSYQVAEEIADGRLEPVLSEFEPPAMPVHIVHRAGRLPSAKVRAFVDLMADRLRADAFLTGGD